MKSESEEGHERNINDMTQVDEYKSPGENKDASTINDSAYYELDEHKVEISDSSKQVEESKSQSQTLTFSTDFVTYQSES